MNHATTPPTDHASLGTQALIEYIRRHFHDVHRAELPELIGLARKVERVHAGHPGAPVGLAEALSRLCDELEVHMQKEEQVLFPMMQRGGNAMIVHPIRQMRLEHDDHSAALEILRAICHDFICPDGACGSWRRLYQGTAKFVRDLEEHIRLENTELFARFE